METQFVESLYPLVFRERDSKTLGNHLKLRHCVELVGMKHVGISNFLRFFLYHESIVKTYIDRVERHMFVEVDLNDLVEKDIFAFWTLTFKRLADKAESFREISSVDKRAISGLFLDTIQSRNFFLTIENLRESLKILVQADILPTIFFVRFDRIREAVSEEFLANLEGMRSACADKLAYVFTSFRSLDELAPEVFSRRSLSVFSHLMYVKPAQEADMRVVLESFEKKYKISSSVLILSKLLAICAGHVQYLQISLIILSDFLARGKKIDETGLLQLILHDERVDLISEEIWESLIEGEREVVKKIVMETAAAPYEEEPRYLLETGLIKVANGGLSLFSALFSYFVRRQIRKRVSETVDFTKKENLLFNLLVANLGDICERETIIEKVWSEYEDMGVSDWTIDQLVARLRGKLKRQGSQYAVKTVRTRGYRLVEES